MNTNPSNQNASESAFETSSGFSKDFYERMLMYFRKIVEKIQQNT